MQEAWARADAAKVNGKSRPTVLADVTVVDLTGSSSDAAPASPPPASRPCP